MVLSSRVTSRSTMESSIKFCRRSKNRSRLRRICAARSGTSGGWRACSCKRRSPSSMANRDKDMADLSVVGQSVYRTDANPKVTGRALHVGNIEMPGMLHVAVLRSPYPHARIKRIDKAKAEALNGVAVVLTGADIAKMPGVDAHFSPAFRDQPILAVEKVCYAGDLVVAVAAVDRRTAEDALQLVEVDYEQLPAVFDVLEAVKPSAPLVHEQPRPAQALADLAHMTAGQQSNICYHFKLRTGDVDTAFAEADRVFEDTFSSPPAQHMPLEPHVTLVYLDEAQRINIWT